MIALQKVIDVALYLIKNPESPPAREFCWLARGIIIHHDEFPLRPSSSEISLIMLPRDRFGEQSKLIKNELLKIDFYFQYILWILIALDINQVKSHSLLTEIFRNS